MSTLPVMLGFTDGDAWRPGIGDPTAVGWFTVAAYAIAVAVCARAAARVLHSPEKRGQFSFWVLLAAIMLVLGINKQLDLQTWLTLTARKLAVSEGWYNYRRPVQLGFILLVFLLGIGGFLFMWRLVFRHGRELKLPLLGLFLVICFVIIRAASFHHIDRFLKYDIGGFKMNWILELGGIAVVIAGTVLAGQSPSETMNGRASLPARAA